MKENNYLGSGSIFFSMRSPFPIESDGTVRLLFRQNADAYKHLK